MTTLSTCPEPTCAVTREGAVSHCPKCGRPMKMIRESRVRGWVIIGCGLVMLGMMVPIAVSLGPSLANPDPGRFTGTPEQARAILHLFWSLIGFGAFCLAGGIYWVMKGQQHKILTGLTFAMLALAILFVWLALKDMKG